MYKGIYVPYVENKFGRYELSCRITVLRFEKSTYVRTYTIIMTYLF